MFVVSCMPPVLSSWFSCVSCGMYWSISYARHGIVGTVVNWLCGHLLYSAHLLALCVCIHQGCVIDNSSPWVYFVHLLSILLIRVFFVALLYSRFV